ncbi:glycerol kinase, partial [Myxococcota bacterium]|nr:glycerol kinase [Myxococcota bacterium]
MSDYILAIDQGTTGSTVLIVEIQSDDARVVARGYAEFPQHFPEPGQVEHELSDIWGSVKQATTAALGLWDKDPSELSAIGITNQRETTGIWDLSSQPIHRAIVWQDRRTAEQCKKLQEAGHLEKVRA